MLARLLRHRLPPAAMMLGVAVGVVCVAFLAAVDVARAQSAFYVAEKQVLAGPPGSVIRLEGMMGAPAGASAYRILYRSRGLHDEPIAVSGVVVVPPGPAPAGGRPIVAWAHPTTGVVQGCAPSRALFIFQQIQGLRQMVERRYVVAATDYDLNSNGGRNLTAMTLWSWQRVFGAPMERVVRPAAVPVVNLLAGECLESIYDFLVRRKPSQLLAQGFFSVRNPVELEPWRSLAASNSPDVLPGDIPVFLSQGADDNLVRPNVTRNYMRGLCRAGSKVRMLLLPKINHGFIGRDSAGAAVDWMADRFAGAPAPDDCGHE